MKYIHIEDVVTGEIECSKVYPMPRINSVAEFDDWYDQILIEDKTLEKCEVCGDTKNWCPELGNINRY